MRTGKLKLRRSKDTIFSFGSSTQLLEMSVLPVALQGEIADDFEAAILSILKPRVQRTAHIFLDAIQKKTSAYDEKFILLSTPLDHFLTITDGSAIEVKVQGRRTRVSLLVLGACLCILVRQPHVLILWSIISQKYSSIFFNTLIKGTTQFFRAACLSAPRFARNAVR